MGWPKGKKRKVAVEAPIESTETVSTSSVATLESTEGTPVQPSRFDLVLGIRRIRGGNFSGLWELSELVEESGILKSVRVMTDANIKPIVIAQIGRRLNECF